MDIEDVRSFERRRRDGRAFVLTGARLPFREKSEFDAHFAVYHRQRTSALRYLPRLIREIHPTKRAKLDFPPHCASIFVVDAKKRLGDKTIKPKGAEKIVCLKRGEEEEKGGNKGSSRRF